MNATLDACRAIARSLRVTGEELIRSGHGYVGPIDFEPAVGWVELSELGTIATLDRSSHPIPKHAARSSHDCRRLQT